MRRRTIETWSLALLGLGCAPAVTPDAGSDASVAQDGAMDDAADASEAAPPDGVLPDVAPPDVADARSDVSPGTCATMPVTEMPSRATVRFRFAATSGWVATAGRYCLPMAIERVDGTALQLGSTAGCLCECAAPPPPAVTAIRALDGTAEVVWDGRALATCTNAVDCATRGWPGQGIQYETRAAMQPVAAGMYRATFPVYADAPRQCAGTGTMLTCTTPPGPPMIGGPIALCSAPMRATVGFALPASGEVVVDVP